MMRVAACLLAIVLAGQLAWAQGLSVGTDGGTSVGVGVGSGGIGPTKAERDATAARCRKYLQQGRDALGKGLFPRALRMGDLAMASAVDRSLSSQSQQLMLDIHKAGAERLGEADKLYQSGEYIAAMEAYEFLVNAFGVTSVSGAARERLKIMEEDPDVRAHLQTARAARVEKALTRLLDEQAPVSTGAKAPREPESQPTSRPAVNSRAARILRLPPSEQLQALTFLEQIVRLFPHAEQTPVARSDVKQLLADSVFAARIAEARQAEQRRQALNKAEMYFHGGGLKQSLPLYEAVVRDYPDSAEAKNAQARIVEIRAKADE